MSQFDPVTFLDAQITEPSIKRPPIPVKDYTAIIGEVKPRNWTKKDDPSVTGIAMDVSLSVEIPAEIQEELGIKLEKGTLTMRDSIMLDLTEQGLIDNSIGKNGKMRKYREACDMNKLGDVFAFSKMTGVPITVRIKHGSWQGEITEEIAGVAKL